MTWLLLEKLLHGNLKQWKKNLVELSIRKIELSSLWGLVKKEEALLKVNLNGSLN